MKQIRNVQDAGLTDFENQMKEAEIASCHVVKIKKPIYSLLPKKQQDEDAKKIATEIELENVLYH